MATGTDPRVRDGVVVDGQQPTRIIERLVGLPEYDPERDIYGVPPEGKPVINLDDNHELDARLYEYNPIARKYRLPRYRTKARFKARMAAVETSYARLKEAGVEPDDWFSMGFDAATGQVLGRTEIGGWANSEYLPMMVGPFTRQLYLYDMLDMHRKAFEAVNHNPLARQIVNLTSGFVIGKGVTATARSTETQRAWDGFAEANDIHRRLRVWCDELTIFGELMLWSKFDRLTREFRVRSTDPATCWEIVTEPDDIEAVYYYHFQYPTAYIQAYGKMPEGVPLMRYIVRQIPADQILHVKVNATSGEKRGRSDLYPVLGWLKRVKDYYTAQVLRAQGQASYVWDDLIKGSDIDVQNHVNWLRLNPPTPGDVYVHNEAVERKPVVVGAGRGPDLSAEGEMLLNLVGVGVGIPKEYLGVSVAGARATALVATEPAAKKFEDRQYTMEWILHQLARRLFNELGIPEKEQDIEFTFPSIATEDRSTKLKDMALAESMNWISHKTAATIAGKELLVTTYGYEEEMKQLKAEGVPDPEATISAQFQMVSKAPPPPAPAGPPQPAGPPGDGAPGAPGELPPHGEPGAVKAEKDAASNPLNPEGKAEMRADLGQKEADPKAAGPVEGADPITTTSATSTTERTTKIEALREQKPTNWRPGYRSKYGSQVESIIGEAQGDVRKFWMVAAGALGAPGVALGRSALIEFVRAYENGAPSLLLPYGSRAYTVGVQKGAALGRDRSTIERHAQAVNTWYAHVKDSTARMAQRMEGWWEEQAIAEEDEEEPRPPVGAFLDRFEKEAIGLVLGLWTLYQAGFRETLTGGALDEGDLVGEEMLDYIAVGDENTCDPCLAAAAGSPYPASRVPLPGEVCLGRDLCRCEIEPV